jgi:hypothetical protein
MWTEVSGLRPADGVQWTWIADQLTLLLEFKGAASFSADDGLQRADDDQEVVDEKVRSAGRGSWAGGECLQSAGEVAHAPCGCGPAPTSDLTHCPGDENQQAPQLKSTAYVTVGERFKRIGEPDAEEWKGCSSLRCTVHEMNTKCRGIGG